MKSERFAPPAPEVQHVPTLLRRVQAGEIRVPAFQRDYVWQEKQIIELLESIYKGYPIGSLLFWQPTQDTIAIKEDAEFPIPKPPDATAATYVLDGQQRLATIYNCFNYREQSRPDRFNVTFDLRTMTFQHYRAQPEWYNWETDKRSVRIHLGTLFLPKAFLAVQQELAQKEDAEELIDKSIALHAAFQEYMIPIVNIRGRDTADVVQMFERVNNTGVKLGAVDFMRAVTWSGQFDLSTVARELIAETEGLGFSIPAETVVKLIAISEDMDPTPVSMLGLRDLGSDTLHKAVKKVEAALKAVISVFKQELRIYSYEYVPYEAHLLVFVNLFMKTNLAPSRKSLDVVKRWFLRTSLQEELQGRADSVVSHLVSDVRLLVADFPRVFEGRLEVAASDLVDRKFIVRRALSSCLAIILAGRGARSLLTGDVIPPEDYMTEFSAGYFVPIWSSKDEGHERRVLPNMLLAAQGERKYFGAKSAALRLCDPQKIPNVVETCESQIISEKACAALGSRDRGLFLQTRAWDIIAAVVEATSSA